MHRFINLTMFFKMLVNGLLSLPQGCFSAVGSSVASLTYRSGWARTWRGAPSLRSHAARGNEKQAGQCCKIFRQTARLLSSLSLGLYLLLSVSGHIALAADSERAAQLYEQGIIAFQADEYASARIHLQNALQADPNLLPARLLLGKVHRTVGDVEAAAKEYRQAREFGADPVQVIPPLARIMLQKGEYEALLERYPITTLQGPARAELLQIHAEAYQALEQWDQAKQALARAVDWRPDAPEPLLEWGRILLSQGERAQAEDLFDRALGLDNQLADAWFFKAEARRAAGDEARALAMYDRAIELDPEHDRALLSRALLRAQQGEYGAAMADVQAVRARLPQLPEAAYLEAMLLVRRGDLKGAQAALQEAATTLDRIPDDSLLWRGQRRWLAGLTAFGLGRFEQARDYLNAFVGNNPEHTAARKVLGATLLELGNAREAMYTLKPAAEQRAEDVELLRLLAVAQRQAGFAQDAVATLEQALQAAPDNAELWLQQGLSLQAAERIESARQHLQQAVKLVPGQVGPRLALARLALDMDDPETALDQAEQVLAQDARAVQAHLLAGLAQQRLGQPAAAQSHFETVLAQEPGNVTANLQLADLELAANQLTAADERLKALLEQHPDNAAIMHRLARIALRQDRLEAAIGWLEQVVAQDVYAVGPSRQLAALYLRNTQPGKVLEVLSRPLSANPTHQGLLRLKARAYTAQGQRQDAVRTYRMLSKLAEDSAPRLYGIARAQRSLNDSEGARITLERAVAATAEFLPAQAMLVNLDRASGRTEAALARARQLQQDSASAALGYALAGDVYRQLGQTRQALQAYEAAWQRSPDSGIAARLGQARLAAGQTEAGFDLFEEWLRDHPDDELVRRAAATSYLNAGRWQAAIRHHERLAEMIPNDANVQNNLGWLYQQVGDPRALATARRAYELAPDSTPVLDTLGWILVTEGQPAKALRFLRDAHSRASQDPGILYHLAKALSDLGRTQEARQHLQTALGQGGDFSERAQAERLRQRLQAM